MTDSNGKQFPRIQRQSFIVCIWSEHRLAGAPVWRGYVETISGERSYFASLANLSRWLSERGGWTEPQEITES